MAASLDELFHESHFHMLNSLTSIYGTTQIACKGGKYKILLAMLKGRIVSFEYKRTKDCLTKADKEVSFTYIPADANIVSIDCFLCEARGLIIAVAFYKEANGRLTNYLNIYCDYMYDASQESDPHDLDKVVENCRSFELGFMPLQLTHFKSDSRKDQSSEQRTVFLLLGDDQRVHVYSQFENGGEFSEQNINDYFPELSNLPGVPTYLDIKETSDRQHRITAVGHRSGDINLFVVDLSAKEWAVSKHSIQHDCPISSVKLFTIHPQVPVPACIRERFRPKHECTKKEDYHLVVASSREDGVIYSSCAKHGFKVPIILENSSDYDCVTSCSIADVDRDGMNDVVIGTYGQEVLVYKLSQLPVTDSPADETTELPTLPLAWSRSFAYPVMNVMFTDLTGDGLSEMAVVTTKGLHVFQCDTESALRQCHEKLLKLKASIIKQAT